MQIRSLSVGCVVLAIAVAVALARAAEPNKATLTIALDDSPQSRMLRSELTRDWTQPNATVARRLTRSQKNDVATRGAQLNAIASKIDAYFRIIFVTPDDAPLSVRFHLPAVRINRGAWETLDRRAFAFEGRPLVTLDWYRARHACICRDTPRAPGGDYWSYCSEEGWSGTETVETPAPWERVNPFPSCE
ncbi:MAG TPA: hypothetical protein VG055_25735 [Planctomycetaceae bacterium]|jgi:hypothetical protein|nr:hypothetical protein [Planctomycetaceae bacterium]